MKTDGGPAFPSLELFEDRFVEAAGKTETVKIFSCPGMTLRDWFAGKALAGMLSNDKENTQPHIIAGWAYQLADAMLVERGKHE